MPRSRAARSRLMGVAATTVGALLFAAPAPARETRELVMSAEFDTRPGGRLTIDVPDADLVLRNGAGDQVAFEIYVTARDMQRGRARFEAMNFRADG